jgi:FHA domain-containing protein
MTPGSSTGTIQEAATGRTCTIEPDYIVGRAPPPATCLLIDKPYVSGVHATLRWIGDGWVARDLGSRNGTYVDGERLGSGDERKLRLGARIGFGTPSEVWVLIDDSPPKVMAVPVAGGEPVITEGDLLALPSSEHPQATIYRATDGTWMLEEATDSTTVVRNRDIFEVDGALWRFCSLGTLSSTVAAGGPSRPTIRQMHLEFAVSRNEEFVQLQVTSGGKKHDFRSRGHNYLLLTLARRRLQDVSDGIAESACGWIDQEDIAHDPSMAPPRLNIDVFRIRRQFEAIGVIDAGNIVERRQRPAQLRIGTGNLRVVPI